MFTLKTAAILALIGSTFAAPLAHRDTPEFGRYTRKIVSVVPADQGNDNTRIVYVVGKPNGGNDDDDDTEVSTHFGHRNGSGKGDDDDTDVSSDTDVSTGTNTGSDTGSTDTGATGGASGGEGDYMSIVSKYRTAGGLGALKQSTKLEANARKTASDGNGQMVHELNPGTFGQVLAPGTADKFEHVYVGGWLCERPNLKGLNGICATMTKGWNHDGQTGHADILSDPKYKEIGCALAKGIWACDVA